MRKVINTMNGNFRRCAICRADVKLYRPYGEFLREARIRCKEHIPNAAKDWYVPLVEDIDGSVWGYMAVPKNALNKWHSLPDTIPQLWIRALALSTVIILIQLS